MSYRIERYYYQKKKKKGKCRKIVFFLFTESSAGAADGLKVAWGHPNSFLYLFTCPFPETSWSGWLMDCVLICHRHFSFLTQSIFTERAHTLGGMPGVPSNLPVLIKALQSQALKTARSKHEYPWKKKSSLQADAQIHWLSLAIQLGSRMGCWRIPHTGATSTGLSFYGYFFSLLSSCCVSI